MPLSPNTPLSALPPTYIALALTLASSSYFAAVAPSDVLARIAGLRALKDEWTGETPPERTRLPHEGEDSLTKWVEANRRLGMWASLEVLRGKGRRGRAKAIERLVECAEECRRLSNHSSMSTLLTSLNAPPISRLMHTWALVSSRHLELLMRLREALPPRTDIAAYSARVELPCVPPLSLFLTTTADTEGPLRLYREIKRYQASCALYPSLIEERLAGLPPPQLHLHGHHSPSGSAVSTPGTSTPTTPAEPAPPLSSPAQNQGSPPSTPPRQHAHHTHHAHHSHSHSHSHHAQHAQHAQHLRSLSGSLSGTSTPGSLNSIPEEGDESDSLSSTNDSPYSLGSSPNSVPGSGTWPAVQAAPTSSPDSPSPALTPSTSTSTSTSTPPSSAPAAAGTPPTHPPPSHPTQPPGSALSYFAYMQHLPRSPSPLRVARPWAERWEAEVERWERGEEERVERGMHLPERVHGHGRAHQVEQQGAELELEVGQGAENAAPSEGTAEVREMHEGERTNTTPPAERLGEGLHAPVRAVQQSQSSSSPGTPSTPPSSSTPSLHPHLPPSRPTTEELISLLEQTLSQVDMTLDLWELSGKAERLTREDVEMREIVMMSERALRGWEGVGAGL